MTTEDSLHEKYDGLETTELLEIVSRRSDYTELAVLVAYKELKNRKVTDGEIRGYQPIIYDANEKLWIKNCLFDLDFLEKIACYFVWLPRLRKYFVRDFIPNGYILKANQSNYYSLVGFLFFIASAIFCQNSIPLFVLLLVFGFFLAYLFDIYYNKERQLKKLQRAIEKQELPFGYW